MKAVGRILRWLFLFPVLLPWTSWKYGVLGKVLAGLWVLLLILRFGFFDLDILELALVIVFLLMLPVILIGRRRNRSKRSQEVTQEADRSPPPKPKSAPVTEQNNVFSKYPDIQKQIPQLKREERYDEAITLLDKYVDDMEKDFSQQKIKSVQSWPYQQLAIIYSKVKNVDGEIAILQRFSKQADSGSKQSRKLLQRLVKAYVKAGKAKDAEEAATELLLKGTGLVVDIETTGFSNQDEIIELGMVAFEYSRATGQIFDVIEEYGSFREPERSIPQSATNHHGITFGDVEGHELDMETCHRLIDKADVLIAHNNSFDRRFLSKLFPKVLDKRWLCSMNDVNWKARGHDTKALQALLEDLEIPAPVAHRALDDAHSTLQLISHSAKGSSEPYFGEMLDKMRYRNLDKVEAVAYG